MTAMMVLDRIAPLEIDEEMKNALAKELGRIGLAAIGVRGSTLVIRVQDRSALPEGSFREPLRVALDAVPGFWEEFDSASFN